MRRSLLEYFFEASANDADIVYVGRPKLRRTLWSRGRLARAAFQFARELKLRNIGAGDRIIIIAENSPEWVIAFWGALIRRVIVVPLDHGSTPDLIGRVIGQTVPKLVLDDRPTQTLDRQTPRLAITDLISTISIHDDAPIEPEETASDELVEIIFTSGTTGNPKGIELTHGNIIANLEPIESGIKRYAKWNFFVRRLRVVNTLPLSHIFGQMMGIFVPNLLRAEVIFQNRLGPNEIIERIKRDKVMVLACVPRVMETLRRKVENDLGVGVRPKRQMAFAGRWWRYRRIHGALGIRFLGFVSGGATLSPVTEKFWSDMGFAVIQGYGMTETAALISLNDPFSARFGSLGQLIDSRNVKLASDGEILVRGKNVSGGEWGGVRRGPDEWLHTGDLGSLDKDGRLYFRSRKKDVIVTATGLNVFPEDIEAVLNDQPEIIESSVVGIDGPNGPQPIAALIIQNEADAGSAVDRANRKLARFQQIGRYIIWPGADFPRTPTQKILRREVAAVVRRTLNDDFATPASSPLDEIIALIAGKYGDAPEAGSTPDIVLDSLSRVELLSALEDRYQVDLDEEAFTESSTIADVERFIHSTVDPSHDRTTFSYPQWPLSRMASWLREVLFYLVVKPVARTLCRADVTGLENLTCIEEPVLFASNHITRADPALIMSVLPRRFRKRLAIAMDGEMLKSFHHHPPGTPLLRRIHSRIKYGSALLFFNVFPLPRQSSFRRSFAFAGEAMDRGFDLLIFPEGELTKDGKIQSFRPGVGMLADGLESPVIPVRIEGLWELKMQGRRYFAPPGSVKIIFGKAIHYARGESAASFAERLKKKL